ncbi:restriction endonuclease subunit S [Citrobacter sp. JGM124]|uniref:restriction endonuclease subunit S n=1 Tax=Citrobacter sp. JGM124 TaxID=2799789 RepID=UPI001BAE1DF9|nr:restriction endonuclease subunit S [Citrobacter sp. JGM124]MBS0849678.1 restriction endonuclease subunit S [Citrobacter sp. JGM124]
MVPKLRFKEFDEQWKEKKLDNLFSTFKSGKSITSEAIYPLGSYPVYGGNGLRGYTDQYTHSGEYFLIGRQGALCGNVNIVNGEVYISEHAIACQANTENDTGFLAQKLRHLNLNRISESSAQPGLSIDKLKKIKIAVPKAKEQNKIAVFFSSVDNKITLLEKQYELLCKYKKGMMQKLFNQEFRFKDDNDEEFPDWDYVNAGELFKNSSNKKHDGDLPILAVTQEYGVVNRDSINIDIKSSQASINTYKKIDAGDFVISLRSFQGGIEYSHLEGICSPAYTVLKSTKLIIDGFYRFFLKKDSFIEELSQTVVGIRDGKQISYQAFASLDLPYPSLSEQAKIANFLSIIDDKITAKKIELDKVKNWKQGMLQQMLV